MEHTQLYTKINSLPDIKSEINDFIDFLMTKRNQNLDVQKYIFISHLTLINLLIILKNICNKLYIKFMSKGHTYFSSIKKRSQYC